MDESAIEIHGAMADRGKNHTLDAAIDLVAGTLGGMASVYIGQPLDTVKVKLQTFPNLYSNAFTCFKETLRSDGIARGLYAGTVPSLAAQMSENAILFLVYGMCQKAVMLARDKTDIKSLNLLENSLAGSVAGGFAAAVLCPTELVKCKLQAMSETSALKGHSTVSAGQKRMSPLTMTRDILLTDGIRGLYRGMVPTIAREMFGYSFFFGGYELCKRMMTPKNAKAGDIDPLTTILCGGAGGFAFWTVVFPADVVKSRVQVLSTNQGRKPFFGMIVHIARTEGVRALYRGLGPTLARAIPATGGLFLVYEYSKRFLLDVTHN